MASKTLTMIGLNFIYFFILVQLLPASLRSSLMKVGDSGKSCFLGWGKKNFIGGGKKKF